MQDDKKIIAFSVIFTLAVLLYSSFYGTDIPAEPEPANISEPVQRVFQEETPETATTQNEPERNQETGKIDAPIPLDAFDEATLEQESSGIQEGIDLLNDPLQ